MVICRGERLSFINVNFTPTPFIQVESVYIYFTAHHTLKSLTTAIYPCSGAMVICRGEGLSFINVNFTPTPFIRSYISL